MRSKLSIGVAIGVVVGVLLSTVVVVLAGSLNPPGDPTEPTSQMYTLEQIYERLSTGAAGTKMPAFTEPGAGPGSGTMHTLDEIMAAAPAVDDAGGAGPDDVAGGKTFWGLTSGAWGPQTGTAAAAPVPKTGQTTSAETGDDGDLQRGVAWPNPRFTDHGDGTVTDNLTGLIWLKNANCFGTRSWANALADANGLASGSCGLTDGSGAGDWRLPNVRELYSLIDLGFWNLALPDTAGTNKWQEGDPFTGVEGNYYWSATSVAQDPSLAWVVHLVSGNPGVSTKSSDAPVWPVRGGQ
jgi:hypothetical protein